MAINLKTEEGFEFSFDTVEELMEFTQRMNAVTESTSDEGPAEDENEVPKKEAKFDIGDKIKVVKNTSSGHVNGTIGEIVGVEYFESESENRWSYVVHPISDYLFEQSLRHKESDLELFNDDIEVGDKVRVISAKDGTSVTFHKFDMGSIVEVEEVYGNGRIEAYDGVLYQTLLHHHYEKVEPLGKDANGEDLYVGDYVTGTEDNDYAYTNDEVVMEVLGAGKSLLFDDANIKVRIDGDLEVYGVDSTRFVKLSDNLDEAKEKFKEIKGVGRVRREEVDEDEQEFKVGDWVRVVGNSHGHLMAIGELREIKDVDSEEPKYNLSEVSQGFWAGTSDIEHAKSSPKFQTGDIVRVTEEFEDHFGDRAKRGSVYEYDENFGFAEPFVGTVFLGDNLDKLELVCRAQDRLDK